MALAKIADRSDIQNVDTEQSQQAKACRLFYDQALTETLEAFDWGFARVVETLADLGTPPNNWAYRYQYPSNCVKFRGFERIPGTPEVPHEIRAKDNTGNEKIILCNIGSAVGVYTLLVTTTSMFTPNFVDALSWRLAGLIAVYLTQDRSLRSDCFTAWREAIDMAGAFDAEEGHDDEEITAPWHDARA